MSVYDTGSLSRAQSAVLDLVPRDSDVLELGANTGYMTTRLKGRACRVVAGEFDRAALLSLVAVADVARWCDLNNLDTLGVFEGGTYDVVVLADVLEHLVDPEQVLRWCRTRLRPGGIVIVSMPNIANWRVRLLLARGRWDMTETGILDRTHLRFYTLASAGALFERAGYTVAAQVPCVQGLPVLTKAARCFSSGSVVGAVERRLGTKLVEARPTVFAYQTVWVLHARNK